jgi:homospermidine synthase
MRNSKIVEGADQLGVLIFGHQKNAYWFGSNLSISQARELAPMQNATALQVTSAILAGMVWPLENATANTRTRIEDLFPENFDRDDSWQFRNILVR